MNYKLFFEQCFSSNFERLVIPSSALDHRTDRPGGKVARLRPLMWPWPPGGPGAMRRRLRCLGKRSEAIPDSWGEIPFPQQLRPVAPRCPRLPEVGLPCQFFGVTAYQPKRTRRQNREPLQEPLQCPRLEFYKCFVLYGVGGGIRTLGHRNHNPALYQLSYTHREGRSYRIRERGRLQIWGGGEVGAGI